MKNEMIFVEFGLFFGKCSTTNTMNYAQASPMFECGCHGVRAWLRCYQFENVRASPSKWSSSSSSSSFSSSSRLPSVSPVVIRLYSLHTFIWLSYS